MKRRAVAATLSIQLGLLWLPVRGAPSEAEEDKRLIEQLRSAGSNLSKPHTVDFYIYLPSRESAQLVAGQLGLMGYTVSVRPAAGGKIPWLALATRSMLLSVESLAQCSTLFRRVIAPHKGEYDGWETGVVR